MLSLKHFHSKTNHANNHPNKQGMIFPMILIMVFIFVLFIIVLTNFNTRNRTINFKDIMRRQAQYVAEAGMQHALLKLKVLQTDCFDALMISQLKNPRFNFAQNTIVTNPRDEKYNPGPRYITTTESERTSMLADPKFSGTAEDETPEGDLKIFIQSFITDIKHDNEKEVSYSSDSTYTFKYGYQAKSVKILGENWDETTNKGSISAEFIIEGYAYNVKGDRVTDTIKRTYKIEKQF